MEEVEAELALPLFPRSLRYLWRAYLRMRRRKAPGFASKSPINHRDMRAFTDVTGLRFHPWEVELLENLDDVYLNQDGTTPPATLPETDAKKVVKSASSSLNGEGVKSVTSSFGKRVVVRKKG